jgi:hypothetical protein
VARGRGEQRLTPSLVKEPGEPEEQYRTEEPLTKVDARNEPAYSITEASRYLRLSPATLRSWVLGRPYPTARGLTQFAPVLNLAKRDPPTLSFSNLIQAHMLRSLRAEHGVSLGAVRQALAYAQRELKIDQLLLREELCTAGGELFLGRYGELTNLSASGQLAMHKVFEAHLKRVEWGKRRFAVRLYPFVSWLLSGTTSCRHAGMRRRSMPLSLRAHESYAHHTDAMGLNDRLIFGGDEMRCTCWDDHEGSGGKGLEA